MDVPLREKPGGLFSQAETELREILSKDAGPFLTCSDVFLTFLLCTYFYL